MPAKSRLNATILIQKFLNTLKLVFPSFCGSIIDDVGVWPVFSFPGVAALNSNFNIFMKSVDFTLKYQANEILDFLTLINVLSKTGAENTMWKNNSV